LPKEEPLIRAVILAAGRGERMQPLSDFVPKPLLFCAGLTLIERLIRSLIEAGVGKFTVGVGWKGDLVREHLTAIPEGRLIEVVDVPDYRRGPLRTLVSALSNVGDRSFLLCPADYVVEPETVSGLISEHTHGSGRRVITMLVDSNRQEGTPVFGHGNGLVAGIGDSAISFNHIGSSAMLLLAMRSFKADCEAALEEGSTQVVSAINRMITEGKPIRYALVRQPWFDVDSLSALLDANHHLLERRTSGTTGTLYVPSGQEVDWRSNIPSSIHLDAGVKVTGPTLVCESCRIESESRIGPFATIGPNCHVGARTIIAESILFEQSEVPGDVTLENAAVYGQTPYRSKTRYVPQ